MKYLLLVTILISFNAIAKPNCENYSPFTFYSGPKNQKLGFSLKRSDILQTEKWDRESEPTLLMSEAIKLANSTVNNQKLEFTLKLESIALRQFGCNAPDRFYYDVSYQTYDDKQHMWGSYHIVVFQNGKVFAPVKIELPQIR